MKNQLEEKKLYNLLQHSVTRFPTEDLQRPESLEIHERDHKVIKMQFVCNC